MHIDVVNVNYFKNAFEIKIVPSGKFVSFSLIGFVSSASNLAILYCEELVIGKMDRKCLSCRVSQRSIQVTHPGTFSDGSDSFVHNLFLHPLLKFPIEISLSSFCIFFPFCPNLNHIS